MGWIIGALSAILRFSLAKTYIHNSHFAMLSTVENPHENNKFLTNYTGVSKTTCAAICDRDQFCLSVYYNKMDRLCLINPFVISETEIESYQNESGLFQYFKREITNRPRSCTEVKQVVPDAEDGHYWIYPQSSSVYGNRVKVYCHQMSGATPLEFISLPNPNVGVFPSLKNLDCTVETQVINGYEGTITFDKIQLDPWMMSSHSRDYTFATWSGIRYPYAATGDCYTSQSKDERAPCGPVGTFKGDLTGTGLKFGATWWTFSQSTFFLFEGNNDNFTVFCGGNCGYCQLQSPHVLLKVNRNDWVELDSATLVDFND